MAERERGERLSDADRRRLHQRGRGRDADEPSEIPALGWKDILKRTWQDLTNDHVSIVAAGIAFYSLLAVIPALAAVISIYGLAADPAQIQRNFDYFRSMLPPDAYKLLTEQMKHLSESNAAAGWGTAISLAVALWGASTGIKGLIDGLNIMYHEKEKRGIVKLTIRALLMTLAAIVVVLISVALIAVLPAVLGFVGLHEATKTLMMVIRWPLLAVIFMLSLSAIFRFGPSRTRAKWRWVTWGAATATVLWLIASGLFSLYVVHFGSYNKTYGSLGAVVVLLMWFYITAYVVLLGAEINTETELQTAKDSTRGAPKPMGRRGAFAADHLGEAEAGA